MKKLGVIVLNYKNYQDTIECIDSILAQDYEGISIIIVDNYSQNESLKILKNKYAFRTNIAIIASDKNLGFARGNNLGINYAIKHEKCDAVFVLNSDTILLDSHVCSAMMEKCEDHVGLINPICIGMDRSIQTPYGRFTSNLKFETLRTLFNIFSGTVQSILGVHFSVTKSSKSYNIASIENSGYLIQGSAYILTPAFFKYYSQLYPGTFLYGEELNLAWYLQKVKLKTVTVSAARILHKEGGSTEASGRKKAFVKLRRQLYSFIRSIPVFICKYDFLFRKYN